ncbi:MAG: patatin family protein [Syntrophomonadaceae bacterium]|nr:patatin family protein [Syntrophomonadaceae bacterium]
MGDRKSRVGLVLGAGSARGFAHIGVLQVLKENNVPVDFIVGSSMGAMVGAVFATGGDIYMTGRMAAALNYSLFWDVGVPRMGLIRGKRIEQLLCMLTKEKNFDELELPLAVVATDIKSGERVVIREGPVYKAVRASISIPGVFEPLKLGDRLLVDGAVGDRLPLGVAWDMGANLVLGVDVTFSDDKDTQINNMMDVMFQAVELLEKQIFENLVRARASVLMQPRLGNFSSRDFSRAEECIIIGRECALQKMDEITKALADCEKTLNKKPGELS